MLSIGIIAEGYTDQIVLDQIIFGYFEDDECLDIKYLQPSRDMTDSSKHDGGGWSNLLGYCADEKRIEAAFLSSNFLVVHLDTDALSNMGFNLTGQEMVEEKISMTKKFILEKFPLNIYQEYQDKLIFAIAVDSIECWLIPIFESENKRKNQTQNCLDRLNRNINRKFGFTISKGHKSFGDKYSALSKDFAKKKKALSLIQKNDSLKHFYDELNRKLEHVNPCLGVAEK